MAYYPGYYQQQYPVYPQGYTQTQQQIQQPIQQPVQQAQPQIQNGGFISVRSEAEARSYNVAPGNSVTFKDENAPYIYTKTMGFSQLDRPIFEKYRLEKEETAQVAYEAQTATENTRSNDLSEYVKRAEFEAVTAKIEGVLDEIDDLKRRLKHHDKSNADHADVADVEK